MKRFFVMVLMLLVSAEFFAESEKQVIQKGIEYHDLAKTESDGYAEKCKTTLKPYIETSMLSRGYYGSAITLQAGYCAESSPIKALDLLRKGSDYIDEAVKKDSDNVELRILRLVNGVQVSKSSPFKRYSVIKDDVEYLSDEKNISPLDKNNLSLVYLYIGYYKIEEGDIDSALDSFDKAVEVLPGSDSAVEAEKILERYEE